MKTIKKIILLVGCIMFLPCLNWSAITAESQQVRAYKNSVESITLHVTSTEGEYFTYRIIKEQEHGEIELLSKNPTGTYFSVTYTPDVDFEGDDSFTFQVMSSKGETSNEATVSITVVTPVSGEIDGAPIEFVPPTPGDGATLAEAPISVATNISDTHYAFINWDDTLVGWWRMDGDPAMGEDATHIYDWSGNGRNGDVYGAVPSTSPFSGAFEFDKSRADYIELNSPISFAKDDNITFAAWIKLHWSTPEKSIFSEGHKNILYLKGNGEIQWRIHSHGPQQFGIKDNSMTEYKYYLASRAGYEEWHHIAAVFDRQAGTLYFYFDGEQDGLRCKDISGITDGFDIDSMIIDGGYWRFNGIIDELMIFKRALSAQEISALYNANKNKLYRVFANQDGQHQYQVKAVDNSAHLFETGQRSVNLDAALAIPEIFLDYPLHQSWQSKDTVSFSWEVTSTLETDFSCNVIIDGAVKGSFAGVGKNKLFQADIPGISDGYHAWSVECTDSLGNKGASITRVFNLDTVNPTLTIISPAADIWTQSDDVSFDVSIDDPQYAYGFIDWEKSLVGWWRAEGDTRDESTSGNHGEFKGDAHIVDNGKFGKAFSFDGEGDSVVIGDLPEFDFHDTDSFTLSAWVNKADQDGVCIIQKSRYFRLFYHGSLRWQFSLGNSEKNAHIYAVEKNPENKWVHLVVVYDASGRTLEMYVDGENKGSQSGISRELGDFSNAYNLQIGGGLYAEVYYKGLIDEVMLFNRALNQEEIKALYNATAENLITAYNDLEDLKQYTYTVYAVNNEGNKKASQTKSIMVDVPNTPPAVILEAPLNPTRSNSSTQEFRISARNTNGDTTLASATLYWDFQGEFRAVETIALSGDNDIAVFTQSGLGESTIAWNCYVVDSNGNGGFAESNYTLIIGQSEYYVAPDGDDSNSGTIDKPFKTIQKFADIALPGDTYYIRQGTYRETVTPVNSGNTLAPITYKAYPGEAVTISGAEVLTRGWIQHRGMIYQTKMEWDLGLGNNQIFVDGKAMMEARWPNADDVMKPGLLDIDSGTFIDKGIHGGATASINDSDLTQASGFWDGAVVHAGWSPRYHAITGTITSYVPGTMEVELHSRPYGGRSAPNIYNGIYYITCSYNALDKETEWFYDSTNSILYLYPPGGMMPSQYTVEAKRRYNGFNLNGKSYIHIEDLDLFACTIITDEESHHITIDNMHAQYPTHFLLIDEGGMGGGGKGANDSGIILDGHHNIIQNSKINYSAGNGVALIGNDCTVHNCEISNVDYTVIGCAAVNSGGGKKLNNRITHNKLYNVGREIILHSNAQNIKILHNEMFNNRYGGEPWDLGATYAIATDGKESEIAYNYIHDIKSIGIYLDWSCHNFNIHHNVVWDVIAKYPTGLHCNTPTTGNKLYNNTIVGAWLSVNSSFEPVTADNTIVRNNICKTLRGSWPAGATLDHNLQIYYTDPLFIDQDNHNFRLQAGSPAINAGVDVGFTHDADGTPIVGAPDIGAYEYNTGFTNQNPVAIFTFHKKIAGSSLYEVSFKALQSYDTDGRIVNYFWDFGDGTTVEGSNYNYVTHQYSEAGSYQVTLTVTDNSGNTASQTQTVTIEKSDAVDTNEFELYAVNVHGTMRKNETLQIQGKADAGARIYSVRILDEKGNVLNINFDHAVTIDAEGNITGTIPIIEIINKYPMLTSFNVEVVIESGGVRLTAQTGLIMLAPFETKIACYNNIIMPSKGITEAIIHAELAESSHLSIIIYDTQGREVKVVMNEDKTPGTYVIRWDATKEGGSKVGSGIYLIHMKAGGYKKTRKIAVVK